MDFASLDEQFNSLSIKFLFVCEDGSELNSLLSELNGLDFKNQQITNSYSIVQFVDSLPKIPTNSDANVIAKACLLIKQLISKQKIVLPQPISNKAIEWILRCCETNHYDLFYCEAIDALSILFKTNLVAVQKHAAKLLTPNGILFKFISRNPTNSQKSQSVDSTPQECYKSSLACIENILFHLASPEADAFETCDEDFKAIGKIFINFIFALKQEDFPENDFILITTLSVKCLKFVINIESEFSTEFIGELVGIGKSFMLFSIPDITAVQPTKIASSQQAIMEPVVIKTRRGNQIQPKTRKIRKVVKKKPEDEFHRSYGFPENATNFVQPPSNSLYRTSDSDFSDNEHSREFANRHKKTKLRLAALALLEVVAITVEKKIMFGYWHSLFSTEESSSAILVNCINKDPSPRCKILALQTIIQLLKLSKPFMVQAENKEKAPATFTPFSVTLGNMISFTYEKLTQALIKEGDLTVLAQILKCLAILITSTPFHRLKTGIVTGFFKYIKHLTMHRDPTVKVCALIVMGNLISISEITPEIYELMEIPRSKLEFSWKIIDEGIQTLNQDNNEELADLEFEDEDFEVEFEEDSEAKPDAAKISWFVQTILENLGVYGSVYKTPSPTISVRVECIRILSALSSHFILLKDHQRAISIALANAFKRTSNEQIFSARTLDILSNSINIYLSQDKKHLQDLDLSVEFWLNMLPSVIEKIQDNREYASLRISLGDALSNIGVHVFEKLDRQKQILLISVLTGCSYDDDGLVRSSAIRALSVYVIFPSMREDLCFIENTIESILRILKDPNILTRTKATFSLGNIVDALLLIRETNSINPNLLKQIFQTSIEAMKDNDRVKVNGVRTTGNLLSLLKAEHLKDPTWLMLFESSIHTLLGLLLNCISVKVKWNVCYSLSSIMKCQIFFDPSLKFKWQDLVFPALCNIIRTSPNFKIRINACTAFTVPTRQNFGMHFINIWSCLLEALEQSNNMTDFNEYKHRETLQDQICLSICHLIDISTIEDIVPMKNEVFPVIDITKQNWNRVFNRWLPECQGKIFNSITSLKNFNCKASEQKNSIEILISCFQPVDQF